jgi:FAD/FMN-containing dehydrogenase/Fe-S oxidoreductase
MRAASASSRLADLRHDWIVPLGVDARFDPLTRILYSTDASNHQVEPLGAAFPRDAEQLAGLLCGASRLEIPIVPRGAGTSLAGQAIGEGLVVECSRHMRAILGISVDERWICAEPGVSLDQLNAAAAPFGLMVGPDPASSDRATLGGMIGNNASGAHAVRYGMTADHVLKTDALLADGTPVTLEPKTEEQARRLALVSGSEGRLYREALRIRAEYAEDVRRDWVRVWRRASGYSLNYLTGFSPSKPEGWYDESLPYVGSEAFNLAPVVCGSEGTLALVHRATLRLVPKPRFTALVVMPFDSTASACEATLEALETRPSAVELIPRAILERARGVPAYARRLDFVVGSPQAILVVEYAADDDRALHASTRLLGARGEVLFEPAAQADLWAVRKVGLGLLMSVRGDTHPVEFIEDVAVPVARLAEYTRRVDVLLAEHGTYSEWYGHASSGCLHVRPMLNLKTARGVAQMEEIADAVAEIVAEMRGSFSGEHGDGLSRTRHNPRLFGQRVMQGFRELKYAFDPAGLLNPGKVVPQDVGGATGLRYGERYRATQIPTYFSYREEGSFSTAVEGCNGAGVCLKDTPVMCPSYQATRDEVHSTRGRANALRAALSGRLPPGALTNQEMYDVLDLCLECKACKAECPSAVDMARIKAEFLAHYQDENGYPLRSRIFGEIARLSQWASPVAGLVNWVAARRSIRWALDRGLGIARQRILPRFTRRTFRKEFSCRRALSDGPEVVLFVDTYMQSMAPEVGMAAVRVLEAAGCRVRLAKGQVCCGRPMISKGMLRQARRQAERNVKALDEYARRGVPIVGVEPSCILTLRDEYLELLPGDEGAARVAARARLIEEFLTEPDATGARPVERLVFLDHPSPLVVHGHCYVKALVGSGPTLSLLRASGAEVAEIPSGCCGMAGSFGYEKEHFALSRQIAESTLLPAVRQASADGSQVVAAGISCRTQIADGTGLRAMHPIEAVAAALRPG